MRTMTLLSLRIGATPLALAYRIASVTAAADTSAPGVPPPKRGAQRAEIDRAIVAVAHRSAGEQGEIAAAARIGERLGLDLVNASMVGEADARDSVVFAVRAHDESAQQHVDARLGTDFVEGAIGRLRIEHHEDAAVALGLHHGAPVAEPGQHVVGDARDGLTRRVARGGRGRTRSTRYASRRVHPGSRRLRSARRGRRFWLRRHQ